VIPPAGGLRGRLRLASGLILLAYVASHLVNAALLLVSLDTAEAFRRPFLAVWRSPPGETLLVGALLVHAGLALTGLFARRTLRMSAWEAAQLALGLAIPILLAAHVLGTVVMHKLYDVQDSYTLVLLGLWPGRPFNQTALVAVVWLHGCFGIHFWLRLRPWYRRLAPWLLGGAVLLPVLALLGFATEGRALAERVALDPALAGVIQKAGNLPPRAIAQTVLGLEPWLVRGFMGLVLLLLAARGLRAALLRRRDELRITYDGGRTIRVARGLTLLEASRAHGLPHAAVCGGRGRCSTCRVRVTAGLGQLPEASATERRVLERVGAAPDVRLACQLRPVAELTVVRLMAVGATARDALHEMNPSQGAEREIAVLFADLRDFTRLAEGRLPYDTVFVLNRYFFAMGEAIEAAGGHVDKFIGDGIMALFGVEVGPREGAKQALAAARGMSAALATLNGELAGELREPLRMGIGLHAGPAIVGEMGYGRAVSLTAVGDTVNVASRLEALTKELGYQLIVSEQLALRAGAYLEGFPLDEVDVRGRSGRLAVRLIADARQLPEPGTEKKAQRWWRWTPEPCGAQ
jgi:adenylate cyclase